MVPVSESSSNLDGFLSRLHSLMPLTIPTPELLDMSTKLTSSLRDGVQTSAESMIPCHIYKLPSGHETGTFLSVDLGGSTLRVALVRLRGIEAQLDKKAAPLEIVEMRSWDGSDIDHLKSLKGDAFFDWIAGRIGEVVGKFGKGFGDGALAMGLSWSFPIGQTSLDSGKIHGMGKGFRVAEDLLGTDLKTHFMKAFQRRSLNITLDAIINDTIAGLLSHAYIAPATRYSLILGTGVNAAMSMPISSLPQNKKPAGINESNNVLLNTELSMFGKNIFPVTEWDDILDAAMDRPGFQPFEYLTGGRYLGEIARLVAVEGGAKHGLFKKGIPQGWEKAYGVQTKLMGAFEEDKTNDLSAASERFLKSHPSSKLDTSDLRALQQIFNHISTRAATYCAVALYSLVKLRESTNPYDPSSEASNVCPIAFCGSTMEKYPLLRQRTQETLDRLVGFDPKDLKSKRIVLEFSHESAILGAAVVVAAAACGTTAPPSPAGEKPTSFDTSTKSGVTSDYNSKEAVSYTTSAASTDDKTVLKTADIKATVKKESKKSRPSGSKKSSSPWKWVVEFLRKFVEKFRIASR